MEADQKPAPEGQPSGRDKQEQKKQEQENPPPDPQNRGGDLRDGDTKEDVVAEASDESFPASDPPAWT